MRRGWDFTGEGADQVAMTLCNTSLPCWYVGGSFFSLLEKCHPVSCFRVLLVCVRVSLMAYLVETAAKGGGSFVSPDKK